MGPVALQSPGHEAKLKPPSQSDKKGLDRNWHSEENGSRASSCLPSFVREFLPFRIAGNSLRGDRWRKKMA